VISVVGGGAWGTALAIHLAGVGEQVRLWLREPELVERMRKHRDNPVYLPGVAVPEEVLPLDDLHGTLRDATLVLAVVPSLYAREVYREMADQLSADTAVVVATKGIEERTLALPLQVAAEEFGAAQPLAILSGPSFADQLARGTPTAVVVGSTDPALAERIRGRLSRGTLRLYSSDDPVGVQVAGSLKNVMAIAAGVADGLNMRSNAQAALITRGLAEMTRLGCALGGRADTFAGLAGLGDLVLTCTGSESRNRRVGHRIGRGERLEDIVASTRSVAEGVRTTRSAAELARNAGVEMPIVEELHRLLFEKGSAQQALERLMARPLKGERAVESS
jgi:glycerol-3-phosphate dehydrogenase (NAD(P)+)